MNSGKQEGIAVSAIAEGISGERTRPIYAKDF